MKELKILIIGFALLFACSPKEKDFSNYIYPKNNLISDIKGIPVDSTSQYFQFDTIETDEINLYFLTKEPILSNYYLSKDVYRLNIFPEFGPSYIIKLEIVGDESYLIAKTIRLISLRTLNNDSIEKYKEKESIIIKKTFLSENTEDCTFTYVYESKTIRLDKKEEKQLLDIFNSIDFWDLSRTIKEPEYLGLGTFYTIEAHTKNNYHYLNRHNEMEDNLNEFVFSLLELAKTKEIIDDSLGLELWNKSKEWY